ncbi:MAG TPA: hypothetical protein VF132_01460, partial [Rudaea sp.]
MMGILGGAALALGAAFSLPNLAPHPGDLDPAFGTASMGYVAYDFFAGDDVLYTLVPLADGRFLGAGSIKSTNTASSGSSANFGIA